MSKYTFKVNAQYKRSEIKAALGLDPDAKGGPWDTGYVQHEGVDFVFCNVGAAGRTGHDYDNYFDGENLVWRGKTNSHKSQPTIQRMTNGDAEVHVFWRINERDPFTYAGCGQAVEVTDETPVRVRWRFRQQQGNKAGRSAERLPAERFKAIGADHVLQAIHMLLDGQSDHPFGPSTDYDLIVFDGERRLPPKAVFGLAATLALGFEVLPKHFTAGETSACFRILRQAGYRIVPKGEEVEVAAPLSDSDQEWAEGRPKLVTHLVRERARGLAQAKRSKFKRDHGKLFCERCKFDPVEAYGSVDGEACIEVHHDEVHVSAMGEGHLTRLDALKCLCANCHRFVHKQLKEGGCEAKG